MYSTGVRKNKMIDKKSLKIPKGSSESVWTNFIDNIVILERPSRER
jgi:exosome complex RNA-binding protein Rrp42 (RNase PH superfamily)